MSDRHHLLNGGSTGSPSEPTKKKGTPAKRRPPEHEWAERIDALYQAMATLAASAPPEQIVARLRAAVMTLMPTAEAAHVFLAEELPAEGVARALAERRPRSTKSVRKIRQILGPQSDVLPTSLSSAIAVPLVYGADLEGLIVLTASRSGAFCYNDRRLLDAFSVTAAVVLYHSALQAEIARMAMTDPLTDVYNRRAFFEFGEREVKRSLRYKHELTAVMLDVDDFKRINDSLGHSAGDRVLSEVARSCRESARDSDLIGRYGGDEFIILLLETGVDDGREIAERLRASVGAAGIATGRGRVQVTISVGVVPLAPTDNLQALLERADQALYAAKAQGRNRVRVAK